MQSIELRNKEWDLIVEALGMLLKEEPTAAYSSGRVPRDNDIQFLIQLIQREREAEVTYF